MPMKQLKLLKPDDTLLIGQVYRLVSFEDVLKEFAAKKCVKLGKLLKENGGLGLGMELKKKKKDLPRTKLCSESGNCSGVKEVHDYFKTLCPDLYITLGDYDEDSCYPEDKTLTIGQFKLGICHGHQFTCLTNRLLSPVLAKRKCGIPVLHGHSNAGASPNQF